MSVILTEPSHLGRTELSGQVVVLDIDSMQVMAPSKAKPWFKVNINAVLPPAGCPDPTSGDWLFTPGVVFYVVAELPDGTFDTSGLPAQKVPEA